MDDSAVVVPPYVAPPLRLSPFPALRLTASRVGDPASARAFARPYRAVTERLRKWQQRGHLQRDSEPALYLHEYSAGGLTVRGLVGGLELARRAAQPADSAVIPHEGVRPGQAQELATRMGEMRMNPAPILLLHRGGGETTRILTELMAAEPDHDFVDRADQAHRIWRITDPSLLAQIDAHLATSRALIADGHHRYAAYLDLQARDPGSRWDQGLAMLVDQDDTPLHLGAIHRVLPGVSVHELERVTRQLGLTTTPATKQEAVAQLGRSTPVAGSADDWRVLDLGIDEHDLAVCLLHARVLPALSPEPQKMTYHHTVREALAAAEKHGGTAILMPAAEFDVVLEQAALGTLLPEKATSFQPKPSLGVLMRSVRDD